MNTYEYMLLCDLTFNSNSQRRSSVRVLQHQVKKSRKRKAEIDEVSQKLMEQMILAGASGKHRVFEDVLQLAFQADGLSIDYLSSFHTVLGMALQHSKMFSERVNVDLKRTRLLSAALSQVVDAEISAMNDFGSRRARDNVSYSPTDVFLGNSEDERTAPTRRLNSLIDQLSPEEGVNVTRNAIHRARNTLRGIPNEDNGYDSEFTARQRQDAVFDTRNISGAGLAAPTNNAQASSDHLAESLSVAFDRRGSVPVPPVARPPANNNTQAEFHRQSEEYSTAFGSRGGAPVPPVARPSADLLDLNIVTAPETNSSTSSGLTDTSSSHFGLVGYSNSSPAVLSPAPAPQRTTAPFVLHGGDSMGSPVHTATTMTGGERIILIYSYMF